MKNRIKELSGKYRSLLVMCIYAVFYMIAFFYLEQRTGAVHQIHFGIDAYIPFCEVFIIPYLMWFGYVAFTVCFLCVRDQEESEKLVAFLMARHDNFYCRFSRISKRSPPKTGCFSKRQCVYKDDCGALCKRHADQRAAKHSCV